MRPPLNAGENHVVGLVLPDVAGASMRPPLNAGENREARPSWTRRGCGFNEAPAERGGKRHVEGEHLHILSRLQ